MLVGLMAMLVGLMSDGYWIPSLKQTAKAPEYQWLEDNMSIWDGRSSGFFVSFREFFQKNAPKSTSLRCFQPKMSQASRREFVSVLLQWVNPTSWKIPFSQNQWGNNSQHCQHLHSWSILPAGYPACWFTETRTRSTSYCPPSAKRWWRTKSKREIRGIFWMFESNMFMNQNSNEIIVSSSRFVFKKKDLSPTFVSVFIRSSLQSICGMLQFINTLAGPQV